MDERYKAFRESIVAQGAYARDYRYYGIYAFCCVVGVAASLYCITLTDNVFLQILNAAFLAFVLVQTGMLGHDLSHGQVFQGAHKNRIAAMVVWGLFGGLSESKWFLKHTAHHASPNELGRDPDLDIPFIFSDTQRRHLTRMQRLLLPYQHIVFFAALPFIYADHVADSVIHVFYKFSHVTLVELALIACHFLIIFAVLFLFLAPFTAALFLVVHMLCIGLYMSLVFAPNHKGQVVLGSDQRGTWLEQITTTRNITPTWYGFQLLGGLNFQIEHHLFPGIARTRYFKISSPLKNFCASASIPYVEVSWRQSIGEIYKALHKQALKSPCM